MTESATAHAGGGWPLFKIVARRDPGAKARLGTGVLVAPSLVLTARHCVLDDDGTIRGHIEVAAHRKGTTAVPVAASVAWPPADDESPTGEWPDAVLLRLGEDGGSHPAPLFGGFPKKVLAFTAWGFPAGEESASRTVTTFLAEGNRDCGGTIELPHRESTGYTLSVRSGHESWSGASGMPVVIDDGRVLVGIAVQAQASVGGNSLRALPLAELLAITSFRELVEEHVIDEETREWCHAQREAARRAGEELLENEPVRDAFLNALASLAPHCCRAEHPLSALMHEPVETIARVFSMAAYALRQQQQMALAENVVRVLRRSIGHYFSPGAVARVRAHLASGRGGAIVGELDFTEPASHALVVAAAEGRDVDLSGVSSPQGTNQVVRGGLFEAPDVPPDRHAEGDAINRALAALPRVAARLANEQPGSSRWKNFFRQAGNPGYAPTPVFFATLGHEWRSSREQLNALCLYLANTTPGLLIVVADNSASGERDWAVLEPLLEALFPQDAEPAEGDP